MIQFKVGRSNWTEDGVARRVAEIIGQSYAWETTSSCPCQHDGKWQLDSANNWFMRRVDEKVYELVYRYTNPERQKALDGLKLFLEFVFD